MKLPVVMPESAALPPLYAGWIDSLLGGAIPAETHATCDDCAMCNSAAAPRGDVNWFNPATKCCTYLPELPNFLVGRILLDTDPGIASHGSIDARLSGSAVNPLGIAPPAAYHAAYKAFPNRFGHSSQMRCPHYIEAGGLCGIWRHRNAVCATWFCKHVRGAVGARFWISLTQLLRSIEKNLSAWCVNELFPNAKGLAELIGTTRNGSPVRVETEDGPLDIPPDSPRYQAIWGEWVGREREFFGRCAELVNPLNWKRVLQLCGQDTQMLARLAQAAYRDLLREQIPDALRLGNVQIVKMSAASVSVAAYAAIDPVEMPRALFDALGEFDGRAASQSLDAISNRHGLELSRDLVRGLVDFEILRPSEPPGK
ncbi:MAG TPA: hypothetical protein VFE47_19325 [Tepidisphaeraceae bacterium]|jgi:hypothetical protein|nr:hypothetical protein [Tepidisphaeraceae bacterium]